MNFGEYEHGTEQTWRHDQTIRPEAAELVNALFGLIGERGEFIDLIKKDVFHGVPADPIAVKKELGDILYYLTRVGKFYGHTLESIAQGNYDKLAARYPNGFVPGGGIRE